MRKINFIVFLSFFPILIFADFIDTQTFFFQEEQNRWDLQGIKGENFYWEFLSKENTKNISIISAELKNDLYIIKKDSISITERAYLDIQAKIGKISFNILPAMYYISNNNAQRYSGMRYWNGLFADFREAYMDINLTDNLFLFFGKKRIKRGYGIYDRALFSGFSMPMDVFGGKINYKDLSVDWFTAQLSVPDSLYLSSHSLQYKNNNFGIVLSEVIIYHRPQLEWYYLNPFALYYIVQYNRRGIYNDNILWDVDVHYKPRKDMYFYGELLIDDFQYDPNTPGPAKLAFVAGSEYFFNRGSVILEYSRVNRWTYTHFIADQIWVYEGVPIGSVLGIDAWKILLSGRYTINKDLLILSEIRYKETGEGNFTDDINNIDDYPTGFPSGIVEKRTKMQTGLFYKFSKGITGIKIFVEQIVNENNIEGNDELDKGIEWSLEWNIYRLTM